MRLYTTAENREKTANIPRRPRRNRIDRSQNVNLPRPSATQPQPSAKKYLQNRREPQLEPHKCERGTIIKTNRSNLINRLLLQRNTLASFAYRRGYRSVDCAVTEITPMRPCWKGTGRGWESADSRRTGIGRRCGRGTVDHRRTARRRRKTCVASTSRVTRTEQTRWSYAPVTNTHTRARTHAHTHTETVTW